MPEKHVRWEKSQKYEKKYVDEKLYTQWNLPVSEEYWLKFMKIDKIPERALDVGCGHQGIWRFSERVTGLDPIDFSEFGKNFIQSKAENMPFTNNYFMDSYSINSLDHCENPQMVMKEMARVTRDRIIIWCYAFDSPMRILFKFAYKPHPYVFTDKMILDMIPENMKVDRFERMSPWEIYKPHTRDFIPRMKLLLASTFGMHVLLIHLRKSV